MSKQTFTLTFGNQAENHKGMQIIGKDVDSGLSLNNLEEAITWFEKKGADYEIIFLNELLIGVEDEEGNEIDIDDDVEEAYLLIIKDGLNYILDESVAEEIGERYTPGWGIKKLHAEQDALEKDTKAYMYGRVVNKKARHNLCFSDFSQEADYEEGKGTIIDFKDVPMTKKLREKWSEIIKDDKVEELQCEGNYYYDVNKTFIGYHGDSERKIVIAVRIGDDFPLFYQWYYKGNPVGKRLKRILENGDVYFMSDKAVGYDWKKKNIYTLRHAAGFEKVLKLKG